MSTFTVVVLTIFVIVLVPIAVYLVKTERDMRRQERWLFDLIEDETWKRFGGARKG